MLGWNVLKLGTADYVVFSRELMSSRTKQTPVTVTVGRGANPLC